MLFTEGVLIAAGDIFKTRLGALMPALSSYHGTTTWQIRFSSPSCEETAPGQVMFLGPSPKAPETLGFELLPL